MALTCEFRRTVADRARRGSAFARALLDEAATLLLNGDPRAAPLVPSDHLNVTIGFERLATETARPSKSLHRMLSDKCNPSMDNLAATISALRKRLGVDLRVQAVEAA